MLRPGAAWSMLSDYPEFLTILAAVALILIFVFRHQLEISSIPQQLIFGSICGGIAEFNRQDISKPSRSG